MNRPLVIVFTAALTLFINGCSEKSAPEPEEKLFSAQRDALDEAKAVEGVLQSAEEERRKKMED